MSVLYRLTREPLVHFLAIGALVFAFYGSGATVPATPARTAIIVSPSHVERLAAQFDAAWQRAPSQAELEALIGDHVREEVYYREALALGLDRDDTVIRRRLRQKMEFLGEGASAALEPDEAALRAHLAAYPERFAKPARVTYRQLPLDEPEAAATVQAALQAGIEPEGVGRFSLLPAVMEAAGEAAVDGTFGTGFFEQV